MHNPTRRREHGQAIALLAIALAAVVAGVGIVVDGGYAFAQRRVSQNAADFAAMAGTRIIGQMHTGRPAGTGTAANVTAAIQSALAANEAVLEDAQYVDDEGLPLGSVVGASQIPPDAFGVVVSARTDWHPFLLGVLGITDWAATSEATAKTTGEANGGGVMPVGIQDMVYDDLDTCDLTSLVPCVEQSLTSGRLNIPVDSGGSPSAVTVLASAATGATAWAWSPAATTASKTTRTCNRRSVRPPSIMAAAPRWGSRAASIGSVV